MSSSKEQFKVGLFFPFWKSLNPVSEWPRGTLPCTASICFLFFFALASQAREWGLRTRSCLLFALRRSDRASQRATQRRDAEKRSMFPQQMGIIHAARVSAALRAPCTQSTPRVSMLRMTHNAPFSPNVFSHLDLVEIVAVYLASVVVQFQSNTLQPSLPITKCDSFKSVQLTMNSSSLTVVFTSV